LDLAAARYATVPPNNSPPRPPCGGARAVDGGLHVEHHLVVVQGSHKAEALRHVGVGYVDIALGAVEQGRRNGEKSRRRVLIGHRANVARHTEYFLDDDDAAAGLAGRFARYADSRCPSAAVSSTSSPMALAVLRCGRKG